MLSLNGLQLGRHSLRITAIDEGHSGFYELDDERSIIIVESRRLFSGTSAVVGRMRFGIERLERIGEIVVVSGWMIDSEKRSAVGDVFGVVGDDHYTLAVSGMPRPEIAASFRTTSRSHVRFHAARPDARAECRKPRPLAHRGRAWRFGL